MIKVIPPDDPKPLGKEVDIRMFIDSDHTCDKSNCRSQTGFMIFINMALVVWFSKRQPTVKSSAFGAKFVALKNGVVTLRELWYKLCMMGIPISGPSLVYGNNMLVIHNTQWPESLLKKKCNFICYHGIHESIAMCKTLTTHVPTTENYADLLTKVLYGQNQWHLAECTLYDI